MTLEITLRSMSEPEFLAYKEKSIPEYAQEKIRSEGYSKEEAHKISVESFDQLLPQGLKTEDSYLFSVILNNSQEVVGMLWFANQDKKIPGRAFVYDISLDSSYRGKGLGKKTMLLLEEEVKKLGLKSIGLHVFAHNQVALNLYQELDFKITNYLMAKDL